MYITPQKRPGTVAATQEKLQINSLRHPPNTQTYKYAPSIHKIQNNCSIFLIGFNIMVVSFLGDVTIINNLDITPGLKSWVK